MITTAYQQLDVIVPPSQVDRALQLRHNGIANAQDFHNKT